MENLGNKIGKWRREKTKRTNEEIRKEHIKVDGGKAKKKGNEKRDREAMKGND